MDGLSAIPPVGDPDYADLHGELAFASSGERAALKLDGFFFAHPMLAAFKRMYDEKRAAVIHATATGYRDRSHFDGQDVLESGHPGPGRTDSGWLNRALGALPHSEHRMRGLGVGAIAPLVIRGPAPALGWAPPGGWRRRATTWASESSISTPTATPCSARVCGKGLRPKS